MTRSEMVRSSHPRPKYCSGRLSKWLAKHLPITKRSSLLGCSWGAGMRARSLAGQRLEARLGCRILNRMGSGRRVTQYGRRVSRAAAREPESVWEPCNYAADQN